MVTTDANIDTTGQRNLTISGELDAATGDFSGDVDIDGTLEADAITVNGTALASVIAGTTVNLATLASTVTITDNESTDENNAIIFTAGGDVDGGSLGLESDGNLTYNPSSGTLNVPNISVTGTQTIVNSVTMNASNAVIFEGATADAHETTLSTVDATADRTINLPNQSGTLPVLAAASATAITSTPEELNILDGATVNVNELNTMDGNANATATTVADADRVVMNDNGTMVQVAVTDLAAYFDDEITAMPNLITTAATTVGALDSGSITSGFTSIDVGAGAITTTGTGTIGNLVVDDVAVNGKVITMTGSSGDTFVTTVGTNGATSLVTTDASAAAAHLQITADGTVDIDGTTITLDSAGDIVLDVAGNDILIKSGGTQTATIRPCWW